MGQVLQAGAGQIPARQAAVAAGIPMTVPVADHQQGLPVRPGRDRAGRPADPGGRVRHRGGRRHGVDDPGAAPAARRPHRAQVRLHRDWLDAMALDGLTDPFDHSPMGELTERHNARLGISRAEQDEFAARSHQRAAAAIKDGLLAEEIVAGRRPAAARGAGPCSTPTRASGRTPPPRRSARLRPAFSADGTITAGSASQISDGACAVVVMSAEAAAAAGHRRAGRGRRARHRGRPGQLAAVPAVPRDQHALGKAGLAVADLDLIEINEAFASVALQSMRDLGVARRQGQRQRRRDRARPPDRRVRRADRPAPGPTSCAGAAAAWARPRCAAAAARATRCCCGRCPRRPGRD